MNHPTARMTRRSLLQFSMAAAAVGVLSSCAPGSSSSPSSVNLQYWQAFNSKKIENWWRANVIEAFNDTNPGVKATLVVKQVDTIDRLTQTALAAGKGPDVVLTAGPSLVKAYKDAGYLAPLDDYAKKFKWEDRLLSWALQTGMIDGKLYAIPTTYETLLTFYNPRTFERHGWTVPKTREEFEAFCADAAGAGVMPVAAGNADYQAASEWFVAIMLNHFAGPDALRQALTGQIRFTDPIFVDAMSTLADWFKKGWFGGSPDAYFTNSFATLYSDLADGKAGLMFTGSWGLGEITSYFGDEAGNDATWDWAPVPQLRDEVPPEVWELSVGGTYSVNAHGSVDVAASLLDFIASDPKRQGRGLAEAGVSPAAIHMEQSDFPTTIDERVSRLFATVAAATDVGYTTWTFFPQKTDTYIAQSWDKVIAGDLTPADYCAGIDKAFRGEVADGFVAPLPATDK